LAKPKDIKTLLAIIGKGPQNLKVVFGNLGVLSKLDAKSQLLNLEVLFIFEMVK
jgi:hypothetical protein